MLQLFLLLFLVPEGFPSLLMDKHEMKEHARVTVTRENRSRKTSADLLSDLLLDLREEIKNTTSSASKIANMQDEETPKDQETLMTKGGHGGKSTFDLQKATILSNHSTTISPKERKSEELTEVKEIGATNVESGTEQGLEGLQRSLTKDIEKNSHDKSSKNAENEDCQPERWCHTTYANEHQTTKEEECKETFSRSCTIEYEKVAEKEQVEVCRYILFYEHFSLKWEIRYQDLLSQATGQGQQMIVKETGTQVVRQFIQQSVRPGKFSIDQEYTVINSLLQAGIYR